MKSPLCLKLALLYLPQLNLLLASFFLNLSYAQVPILWQAGKQECPRKALRAVLQVMQLIFLPWLEAARLPRCLPSFLDLWCNNFPLLFQEMVSNTTLGSGDRLRDV